MNDTKPYTVKGIGVTTPKGKALWCHNIEPQRKYNKEGDLTTSLVLDPKESDVKEFVALLEGLRDQAYDETVATFGAVKGKLVEKAPVFQEEADKEGNLSGNILIKLKLKDVDIKKAEGKQSTIITYDAKKNVINDPLRVGNHSIIRCSGFANPYYMASTKKVGISIIWQKMQILDLVEIGGGDSFVEEEGFESVIKELFDETAPF
jgi:hypothetical protein